jgi:TetR/AcrR family fatty acid metabolism transcriptional regulator
MSYMKAADRERHILDCAKKVFADRGYHAANISHICAEAGIGRGTLYQYFRNKKAVFTAILTETLERVRTLMESRRPRRWPDPADLRRGAVVEWSARRLEQIFATVFEDERTLRIVLREAGALDVDVEQLIGEIDASLIAIVEADLRSAQEAGIVRPIDPHLTATLMVGGIEKIAVAALRGDGPVDLHLLARETARLHNIGLLSDRICSEAAEGPEDEGNTR